MLRIATAAVTLCVLVACAPQAPPSLRPYPLPVASRIVIPIIPHCSYGGGAMDWTFTPTAGVVPAVAWYTIIDQVYGPHQAGQIIAGTPSTVVVRVLPWQLFMLASDTTWVPVSGVVVNPPPLCA